MTDVSFEAERFVLLLGGSDRSFFNGFLGKSIVFVGKRIVFVGKGILFRFLPTNQPFRDLEKID